MPDMATTPVASPDARAPELSERADLHTHSRVSDGTDTPAQLVRAAADAGLGAVALTDHDTTDGWAEASAALEALPAGSRPKLVRGTEISVRADGVSVHLLSYLHDPQDPTLSAALARARDSRAHRARRMVDLLAEDFPVTWEDVLAQAQEGTTLGRPHIADALVAAGVVPDRSAAFASVLMSSSPYYVPYEAPGHVEAVEFVRAAGGVPVIAHPFAAARGRVLTRRALGEMIDAGLAGLEVDHRDHTPADRERAAEVARRHGLLTTGSSDYHGSGKPNRLAENTTGFDVLERIAELGRLPVLG